MSSLKTLIPIFLSLLCFQIFSAEAWAGSTFYVSPTGSSTGSGSISNPWDLKTALNHPPSVQPGDTIYLRGGTYHALTAGLCYYSVLTGTAQAPIKVKSYPGEWAVIDGNVSTSFLKNLTVLTIAGSYSWFMNLEITNSETATRKIDIQGSNPYQRRANAIDDRGRGTKLVNLVIHDTGQGIGAWSDGQDNEYYGNIVYNNGWDAPDRLHGHGNYVQNQTGWKRFEDNFFFNAFGDNSSLYGSSQVATRNVEWIGKLSLMAECRGWGSNMSALRVRKLYLHHYSSSNSLIFNTEQTPNNFQARCLDSSKSLPLSVVPKRV